jgi:hypothetical protein
VLRHFKARDEVRVERREQYSVDNRVVPPDAVVLGDLSHQLVCRRVVPATEQRFHSKLLPDPKRQSLVAQLHARSRRYGLEHGCCAWER